MDRNSRQSNLSGKVKHKEGDKKKMIEWYMNNSWLTAFILGSVALNIILYKGIKDLHKYYNVNKNP